MDVNGCCGDDGGMDVGEVMDDEGWGETVQ